MHILFSCRDVQRNEFGWVDDSLLDKVKNSPSDSGVYFWKDSLGGILYIGKAGKLRNRLRQYLVSSDYKTRFLMEKAADVEWIATSNETEALILENNLIKKHHPPYNIRLKDDKNYPYICVSTGESFPRVFITRKKKNPKHTYFGPFADARAVHHLIEIIHRVFPIRKRNLKLPMKTPQRPCVNYHIGRCWAPCTGKVDTEEYGHLVESILDFLNGKREEILEKISQEMERYSHEMQYEKAARYRDFVYAIRNIQEKQDMEDASGNSDFDVVGVYTSDLKSLRLEMGIDYPDSGREEFLFSQVSVLKIRSGKVIHKASYAMTEELKDISPDQNSEDTQKRILTAFFRDFYWNPQEVPPVIWTGIHGNADPEWEKYFLSSGLGNVRILTMADTEKGGYTFRLGSLAGKNAALSLKERILSERYRNQKLGLLQLQKSLDLKKIPSVIECYDISNFQGKEAVASGVMLKDGMPHKSGYRKYRIRSLDEPNDPGMIYEVISRRMRKFREGIESIPDLMVMDGGITQLRAALRAREEAGISVPIISLAKKEEEIYTEHGEIIQSDPNSPGMLVLRLARDEAHRFGVAYHRNLRMKRNLKSVFESIPGMGEKKIRELQIWLRKKNLDDAFLSGMESEIRKLPGMTSASAETMDAITARIRAMAAQ